MNINQTANIKVRNQAGIPEENIQNGQKTAAGQKETIDVRAAAYENRQKITGKKQNGITSGTYSAAQGKEELEKSLLETNTEKKEDTSGALNTSADTLTEEDCASLEEEGMTLEAYEAERLSRAIARMKENREFTQENLENRMENREEYDKEIQKIALKNKISDSTARRLGQKLIDSGLPITEANIMAMVQALDMGSSVNRLSDNGMAYMIENHQEATIENIHNASYAGTAVMPAEEAAWEAVKGQVEEVIEDSGRPVNEETLGDGRWLLNHELPVTKETLEELENLKGIRVQANEDYLLDRMAEAVRHGRLPKEANLDLETIRIRRKLEEIRLSMSQEASKTLESKGIVIDTEHIKQVIDELKVIEKEYYKALLSEAGELERAGNTDRLKELLEKTEAVGKSPAHILGETLETRQKETLETLYQAGEAAKQQTAKLEDVYEPLRTSPRRDLGDSIQKAFQNVEALLSELKLEATEENQRAVRILGYNRMQITEDSINKVKAYDAQVNDVLHNLKPAIAIELIRRGQNPLNMPLEELRNSIHAIKDTIGSGSEEKYSTYLWKLEKQDGQISESERKSYIGIYRLLNNIEKADGAAVGAVLDTGRELNLSNLLTAVRTLKSKGIDQKIDDDFGGLESLTFSSENISDQISAAFRSDDRIAYFQNLVSSTLEEISPEQVAKVMQETQGNALEMSLESFCENVRGQEKDVQLERDRQKQQMEQVQELAKDSEAAIAFLETYGATKTIRNIQAAGEWFTGNKNLFKELDRKADTISEEKKSAYRQCTKELLDSMEGEESLKAGYRSAVDSMNNIAAEAFSDPELTSEAAEVLRLMQKGIALAGRLSRQEHYEMPVVIGDEVSSLSLTILKGTMDSGKAEIRIEFPQQGTVEADITIRNNEIKGFILCETTEGRQLTEECLEDIKQGFESLGLAVKQMSVAVGGATARWASKEAKPEGKPTETRMLYQAAKILVKKTIERTQVTGHEN